MTEKRKQTWTPIKLTDVGTVAEIVHSPGGGKLSIQANDSGDSRKPIGQE